MAASFGCYLMTVIEEKKLHGSSCVDIKKILISKVKKVKAVRLLEIQMALFATNVKQNNYLLISKTGSKNQYTYSKTIYLTAQSVYSNADYYSTPTASL